jgi:serine/threonine protein kinase
LLVLNLCQQFCPEKIPVKTAERLGHGGADGETFAIKNDPTKAIKFSIIYDRFSQSPISIYQKEIAPTLDFIMTVKPTICATVYEYGYLGEYVREMPYWKDGYQNFVIHYCIMEKLLPLTEDEKKVFHTLISHEDRKIKKDLSPEKIGETLRGLARGLDFDAEMIILFCEQMRKTNFSHSDIHPRNILKDTNGHYKFIDFDRAILE